MTTKQSIERLSYTISKSNKPNETDKIALNKIISDINKQATDTVVENQLFAKLYAIVLKDFIVHYQNIDFANTQINKELSLPMSFHLEMLRLELNQVEMHNFFKSKGICDPYLMLPKSWQEVHEVLDRNKELFPQISVQEFLEACETWDTDNTVSNFVYTVNQSLITYKNV